MDVLIVVQQYPNDKRPYVDSFIEAINGKYERTEIFTFLPGKLPKENNKVLRRSVKTFFSLSKNPFSYLKPAIYILLNLRHSLDFLNRSKKGLFRVSVKQLFNGYQLLGKGHDLVYINDLSSSRHFSFRALFPNARIIVGAKGQDFDFGIKLKPGLIEEIDVLHVISKHLLKKAIEYGFPENKIEIINPFCLPIEFSKRDNSKKEVITIISVGRLVWLKGFHYLIRAFAKAKDELDGSLELRLKIVGKGPYEGALKYEAARLGVLNSVEFLGWIESEMVPEELSKADIFALLSFSEGFNTSILQAQYCSLPCICSDNSGISESIIPNETGFLTTFWDSELVCDQIKELSVDPQLRQKMGEKGRENVEKNFSKENIMNQFYSMFGNVD